jgi:ribosome biogenesis protein BRX1
VNKQRVLVFAARGITQRDRHLMVDLRDMMPHSKTESKFERKDPLFVINEVTFSFQFHKLSTNIQITSSCRFVK